MTRPPDSGKPPKTAFSALLVRRGVTSAMLAEATGFSRKAVEAWRSGERRPSEEGLDALAEAVGLDGETILDLLEEKHGTNERSKSRRAVP